MITALTKDDLIQFENRVAEEFNRGTIRAPIHLYSGNEEQIIDAFQEVDQSDWVLCSWRSHYQCLLKGVPGDIIFREIMEGRSISLCFPEYKIFCSALVGGIVPIAVGIALSIKRRHGKNRVHCFVGDMTAETGIFHESLKYSRNFDLPIRFVIEDNGKSVCTDTRVAWGTKRLTYQDLKDPMIVYYRYETKYPHAGAGVRVQF